MDEYQARVVCLEERIYGYEYATIGAEIARERRAKRRWARVHELDMYYSPWEEEWMQAKVCDVTGFDGTYDEFLAQYYAKEDA